ncbi:MAG: iron-sulfur cluster repair di-iron protein [Chitinophagales bacterium]
MKNELLSKTLAQIVNENHQTASVFEKYELDFCCNGKRSLQKACEEKKLTPDFVAGEIEMVSHQANNASKDFDKLSLTELADYIVSTHHAYTKNELPRIFAYLQKVSSKHGDRHNELYKVFEIFISLREELELHMQKEEVILFPRIKDLEHFSGNDKQGKMNIQTPVNVMENEHEHAGNLLREIRQLANNYTPPVDACTTYRLSFAALQALETDLHQHIHLENNILFPKAIALFNSTQGVQ